MSNPDEKTLRCFEVAYRSGPGIVFQTVKAAYWQSGTNSGNAAGTHDGLIRFKDTEHKPVFAVRADLVETITERRDTAPHDLDGDTESI